MAILRHLQHWFSGHGPHLQTAAFVPEIHSIRLGADTFPWDAMVQAVAHSFAQRFPTKRPTGGRPSVSLRVLLALELLTHELNASDEDICQRLRTDVAVMDACGLPEVHADPSHAHVVFPETLAQFRGRLDHDVMDTLVAIQAAAAMEAGLVSPAPLLVDTFPAEQGSQRVNASPMPQRCIRRKKTPAPPRTPQYAVRASGLTPEDPRARTPPDAAKSPAELWAPVSGPREGLRHPGAADGKAVARPRGCPYHVDPRGHSPPGAGSPPQRGPAWASAA